MRAIARSFAVAIAVSSWLDLALPQPVHGQATRYAGRPLADALRDLGSLGLTILFTAEVVKPQMVVEREPASPDPRRALDEMLAAHDLIARVGPGGVLVVESSRAPPAEYGSIEGEVRALGGSIAGAPGARAEVVVRMEPDGDLRVPVDDAGRFTIGSLLPRLYVVEASAEGFLPQRVDVEVVAGKTRRVVFQLHPQPFVEEEIVVRPSRLTLLEERPASTFAMSRDDLERLPHLGGDVLRAASLLPGTAANDVTAQLSVHGGRRDEVSVLLDGQELYEAYHLKDYDNALAIVPALALDSASLSTGAYAASYGDRMSGVLDLRTAEPGSAPRWVLSASVLDLLASSSGSWGGERDGGWLVTGRRGSIDLASEFLGNEDPGFWDLLAKAEVSSGVGRITGHLLASGDELELDRTEGDDFERLENDYESRYLWLAHQATPGDRLLVETTASWANVRRDRVGSTDEEKGSFEVVDRRDLDVGGIAQSWTLDGAGRHQPSWGAELRRYDAGFGYARLLDPEFVILAPFSPPRPEQHAFDDTLRGDHVGVWATDRVRLFERLTTELGLRFDRHRATDDELWSPRLNLAWRLDATSVVRASWGRFYQSQRPYELQVEDAEETLFGAERAEHSLLGYEAVFGGHRAGLQGLRVELFRRDLAHPRPRYENLLEPLNFLPEIEPDRVRITPESGEAEGIELLVRARGGARLDAWLAYTYSRARDRIEGRAVPRSLDQPHAGTLGIDYRPTARSSLAAAWRWRSGWPTTPVFSIELPDAEDPGEVEHQLVFGRLSSELLGSYHRLDLRASHRVPLERGSLLLFLDLQNVYDRANDAGFDVTIDDETGAVVREPESWPGIFPSLGVVWEF